MRAEVFAVFQERESSVSEQDERQTVVQQRPATRDQDEWKTYWKAQGQSWRTEPEIDEERQKYLTERRSITPDIEKGIYPFKDIKLSRADVEWLLATHESSGMRGAVDWSDESQRKRTGLDLRGADLRGVDLDRLSLARIIAGLVSSPFGSGGDLLETATIHLEGATLRFAHLEGANLYNAHLEGANLYNAYLEGAKLYTAHLQKAYLHNAHLEGAALIGATLKGADLNYAYLGSADLHDAHLEEADLNHASLIGATLHDAHLERANLYTAYLGGADLHVAHLERANLYTAHLEGADLHDAHLEGADLSQAQLQGANLSQAQLQGANLHRADLEAAKLDGVALSDQKYGSARLADIRWGEVNLAVIDWRHVRELGDEQAAQQEKDSDGKIKGKLTRIDEYKEAVRANRQLAVVLRNQGLNEEADHFAYRAQLLQRKVFWREHEFGRWLFSLLLALLSGYGYRIWRILAAYLLTISVFALAYFVLGMHYPPHLPLHQAFLESITALHGRVFFEQFNPNTPQIWLTALEAIAGLIIEGVFIAMLIQRFFGK